MGQGSRGEALFINFNGKRFVNETFAAGDLTWVTLQQPKNAFYSVMDSKVLFEESLPRVAIITSGNKGGRNVEAGVPDPNEKESTTNTAPQGMPAMPGMPAMHYSTDASLQGIEYKAPVNLSMAGAWNMALKITRHDKTEMVNFNVDVR